MTSTLYWSLFIMLPFQSNRRRTSTPYLVVHILDDKENWTVERCRFTVQSLQASPMLQCTVCKPPRISLHSCGQAPGKLGNEQGQMVTYSTAWVTGGAPRYSLSAGASEPKNGCQGISWCQQLNISATYTWPCALSPTVCIHITCERFQNWHPLSEHWKSCQSSTSQLKLQSRKTQKYAFQVSQCCSKQDLAQGHSNTLSTSQTLKKHWHCLQKAERPTVGRDSTTAKRETWGFSSHTCSMCIFSRRALWCFKTGKVSSSSSS